MPECKQILWKPEMVRALLTGRKTMTRRIVSPQPVLAIMDGKANDALWAASDAGIIPKQNGQPIWKWNGCFYMPWPEAISNAAPYQPGDILWGRETFVSKAWDDDECRKVGCADAPSHPSETYLDVPLRAIHRASYKKVFGNAGPWRPSIFMPFWACRLFHEVTDVRVERVQEITKNDAVAEGCPVRDAGSCCVDGVPVHQVPFMDLWERLHGPDAWDRNDWVFVYTFKPSTREAAERMRE